MLGTTTTGSLVDPSSSTFDRTTDKKGRGANDTQTVGNLLVQPEGHESYLQSMRRAQSEVVYKSHKIKLGKSYIRGLGVPRVALGVHDYCHGIKSNACSNETAKSLVFPELTESKQDEENLYRNKSRRSYGPGEQLRRYEPGVCGDSSTIYGKHGEGSPSNHVSASVSAILSPSPAENSHEQQQQQQVGGHDDALITRRTGRSVGSDNTMNSRLPPDHIYGIASKTTDWGTKEGLVGSCCDEQEGGEEEDLSKYQQDATRVFGISSIRNSCQRPDGDKVGIGSLMKPSPLRSLGLEDDFTTGLPEKELLEFFCEAGCDYTEGEFRQVFLQATKGESGGRVSISEIQEAIRGYEASKLEWTKNFK